MDNKLSELSKPVGFVSKLAVELLEEGLTASIRPLDDVAGISPLYSQEYVSALLARIEELEWRELNSTELKELLTWHPTKRSAATDPILWAAMRNKINFTLARVAADEAMKEQSNG